MSWQAVHRVLAYGPDDDKLFRLLINVAYAADPDGRDAKIGYRFLAERCHASIYRIRELLFTAVDDDWLELARRGSGSGKSIYDLGSRLADRAFARDISREGCEIRAQLRAPAREIERGIAQKKYVSTSRGRRAARPARGRRAASEGTDPSPPVPGDPPSNGKSIYDDPYRFPNWTNGEGRPV